MPKFSKGAQLIDEDGNVQHLEGVDFELRPMTNLVRIQAARMTRKLDSDEELEIMRASFKTFRGAKCPVDFPEFVQMNVLAMKDVNIEFRALNPVGDGPLEKTKP